MRAGDGLEPEFHTAHISAQRRSGVDRENEPGQRMANRRQSALKSWRTSAVSGQKQCRRATCATRLRGQERAEAHGEEVAVQRHQLRAVAAGAAWANGVQTACQGRVRAEAEAEKRRISGGQFAQKRACKAKE